MGPDSELTAALVEGDAEPALTELVRRYVDLVYAAALRQVGGDAHLAKDVVQVVFTRFVRQAAALRHRASLGGWFYTTAHHVAANVVRSERRRKQRETEAHLMENTGPATEPEADWDLLQPVLDHAMHEINERDRDALRLRYFERLPVAVVAAKLGVTENAAAKRIERALEKLRARFTRRGITSTSLALAAVLEGQVSIAAPAGFAASVTASALTSAAATAGATGLGVFAFMSTAKITASLVVAAVAIGTGAAWLSTTARTSRSALTASLQQQATLNGKLGELETQLQRETKRLQLAEEQNGKLLNSAKKMQAGDAAQAEADALPITSEMVSARFKRAQELVKTGDPALALRELLWCYNTGMPRISGMSAVRVSFLPAALSELGERYPPALAALRDLRDQALPRVQASERDFEATQEFASLNYALKDDQANLTLFDQFPPGDSRRKLLAGASFDYLVTNQRYQDAAEGKPYSTISSMFELLIEHDTPQDPENAITLTAKNIEMLAGVGDLEHARALAARLLAYDNSPSTRAVIQQHAARAGQPNLLAPTTP
jgi:RNA polymerase sigma factor (sigma-70 family)